MNILEYLDKMSTIRRWSQSHCTKAESVLEHTGFVAMYALSICYEHGISPSFVIEKAILHDMEEVITGDIPTTTKYLNKDIEDQIKSIESISAKKISDDVFFSRAFHIWELSKDTNTESGAIVSISDSAAVVHKIIQEVSMGNLRFLEFKDNIVFALEGKLGICNSRFDRNINQLIEMVNSL